MKMRNFLSLSTILVGCLLTVASCSKSRHADQPLPHVVINEIMPSNRTGLLTNEGTTADWIEIKNLEEDTVNLEGFKLSVIKRVIVDSLESDTAVKVKTWSFPDVNIAEGECLIVFAEKEKKKAGKEKSKKNSKSLIADFNLPKEGGTVQFLSPDDEIINEVTYGQMAADHSFARQSDSTYTATYWQSPGFDNNRHGYEQANERIDKQRQSPLLIWEVMSRSKKSNENWVELKNVSDAEIDLSEYSLSKKEGKKEGWRLPERKLQPGEFITIRLMGKKANPNNVLHAPFKLSNAETVILSRKGKFADGMCAKPTVYGGSIGRSAASKGFFFYNTPTKNEENGKDGRRYIADKPQFDHEPGIYSKDDTLVLRLKDRSRTVHYTLDGSEPTTASPVLKDSLMLTKSAVIRTFARGDSATLRSGIATATYLLGVEHDMPVVNISVNHNDLYGYTNGIYADGPGYSPEWPHHGANFWNMWTKKAHVEFFDNNDNDGFSVDCGLMIFGGYSRYEAKKSFRLKFRGEYGDTEVDYDFFDNGQPLELEDLILRSGSQDFNRCMIRDEFFTSLMKENSPTILTQIYRPVALYVNAKYFGLYYVREKIDKHFVSRHLNVPTDSVNIIMSKGYNEEGSSIPYNRLMQYVSSHDMTNSDNYKYIRDNVDLTGLIDYKLGQIYSGNTDVGNIRYVRSTSPESDKKWHFVFYDLDATWVGYKPDAAFYLSTGPTAEGVSAHNILINRLLANKDFRALFLQRLSHHMTNTFSEKNTTAVFDKLVSQIRPEMERNCERWPQLSYDQWEKNIESFRAKFSDKHKIMLNDLRQYLRVTDEENKKYFGHLGF
ncbi:MAG: CotH kinase family protein [Paramuribaculum sp.]|nr:CotH kinase family protein [Paramuribaculum sp.]